MLNNHSMALPKAKDRRGLFIKCYPFMKKSTNQKKLHLTKIKISSLSKPKQTKGGVCLTSVDQTTCGCRTLDCTLDCV